MALTELEELEFLELLELEGGIDISVKQPVSELFKGPRAVSEGVSSEDRQLLTDNDPEDEIQMKSANTAYISDKTGVDPDMISDNYREFSMAIGGTGDSVIDFPQRQKGLKIKAELKEENLFKKVGKKLVTGFAAEGVLGAGQALSEQARVLGQGSIATIREIFSGQKEKEIEAAGGREQMFKDMDRVREISGDLPDFSDVTRQLQFKKPATKAERQEALRLFDKVQSLQTGSFVRVEEEIFAGEGKGFLGKLTQAFAKDRETLREKFAVDPEFAAQWYGQLISGAGQLLATVPTFLVSPTAGLALIEGQIFQGSVDDYYETIGVSPSSASDEQKTEAFMVGMTNAVLQTGLEASPLGIITGKIFKAGKMTFKEGLKRLVASLAAEGLTEPAQGIIQDFIASDIFEERDLLFTEEAFKKRLTELFIGGILGAGVSGISSGFEAVTQPAPLSFDNIPITEGEWKVAREVWTDEDIKGSDIKPELQNKVIDGLNGSVDAQNDIYEAGKLEDELPPPIPTDSKDNVVFESEETISQVTEAKKPTGDITDFKQIKERLEEDEVPGQIAEEADQVIAEDIIKAPHAPEAPSKFFQRQNPVGIFGRLIEPISGRLRRISPGVMFEGRRFVNDLNVNRKNDIDISRPFLDGFKDLSKEDSSALDIALKNSDVNTARGILSANGLTEEFQQVRDMLDLKFKEIKATGIEVGFIEDYFPRQIKDLEGLREFLGKTNVDDILQTQIDKAQLKKGSELTQEERADIANKVLQGIRRRKSRPGNLKERDIKAVDEAINKFYAPPQEALSNYINRVNEFLGIKRFFGKSLVIDDNKVNIQESIGAFVEQMHAKGEIKGFQIKEMQTILDALFNFRPTSGIVQTARSLGYITTLGQLSTAITQLGDLTWSIYKGGVWNTFNAVGKAAVRKADISREDLGIRDFGEEYRELGSMQKALKIVFKATGLDYFDKVGKEALINSSLKKLRTNAKADKLTNDQLNELEWMFGQELEQAITDLKSEKRTPNTDFIAFNTLSDFQPVSLLEMPEAYLRHPDGRIFYMLKTFTIKQVDSFRREGIDVMLQGARNGDSAQFAKGFKQLMTLASLLAASGAGADLLKDLLYDRHIDLTDKIVDNLLKMIGISKYSSEQLVRGDVGSFLLSTFGFPLPYIEYPVRDINRTIKTMQDGEFDPTQLQSYRLIPVFGNFIHFTIGVGKTREEKKKKLGEIIE